MRAGKLIAVIGTDEDRFEAEANSRLVQRGVADMAAYAGINDYAHLVRRGRQFVQEFQALHV